MNAPVNLATVIKKSSSLPTDEDAAVISYLYVVAFTSDEKLHMSTNYNNLSLLFASNLYDTKLQQQ